MRKWQIAAALAAVMTLSAGVIMAQAPDVQPGQKDRAGRKERKERKDRKDHGERGERADRPQRGQMFRQAPADGGLSRLIPADAQIAVANVATGVELLVTVEKPEQAQALQKQLTQATERMNQMVERMAQMRDRMPDFQMPGVAGLVIKGKITLAVANRDNGATVTFASDDAETVKTLQTDMPKWVEGIAATRAQAAARREQMEARQKMTALLKAEKVKIEIVEDEAGVNVKFTTDDAEARKTLQEIMPAYIEGLKNPADTGRRGGRPGAGRGGRDRGRDERGNRGEPAERAFPVPADQ